MSEENQDNITNQEEKNIEAQGLPVTIHAQYVKDVSFENPNAPDSLRGGTTPPATNIQINMDARELKDDNVKGLYEVVLTLKADAVRGDDTLFIAEIFYGVTVQVSEQVDEDKIHPLLLIEIPKFAFPFVRKIVRDLVLEGGFALLYIAPVDFHALYMKRFANKGSEAA